MEQRNLLTSVTLTATDSVATERGYAPGHIQETPDYAEVCVTRSDSNSSATIGLRLEGEATTGSDYTLWKGTRIGNEISYSQLFVYDAGTGSDYRTTSFIMGMGESSATIQICPRNDQDKEVAEQATLSLNYYYVYGQAAENLSGSCSVTINDNDAWSASVSVIDGLASEAPTGSEDYATVRFTRSGETDVTHSLNVAFETYGDAGTDDYTLWAVERDYNNTVTYTQLSSYYSYWDEVIQEQRVHWDVAIPVGATEVDVQLRPQNDARRELDEDVTFAVLPSSSEYGYGAYTATGENATITIRDNDDWSVQALSTDPEAAEAPDSDLDYGVITITRSGSEDTTYSLNVPFAISGDASFASDYALYVGDAALSLNSYTENGVTRYRGNVMIPADSFSATIEVRPVNDSLREDDETVTLTLLPATVQYDNGLPLYVVAGDPADVVINDNDDWFVSVTAGDSEAKETPSPTHDDGIFVVTRSGETDATYPLTTYFTITGDATYYSDYRLFALGGVAFNVNPVTNPQSGAVTCTGTLTIPAGATEARIRVRPVNDQQKESDETVVFTLSAPEEARYTVGTPGAAEMTIRDNDNWFVSIEATDATAAEANGGTANYGSYTITRSGEDDTTFPLRVYLEAVGSATYQDYQLYLLSDGEAVPISVIPRVHPEKQTTYYPWSVQIPANQTSVVVELRPVDDSYAESDEDATMEILENSFYTISEDGGSATVTIEETTRVWLTTVDDLALEPCTWITAAERRAQYRLNVFTTETNRENISVRLNVSGTATPGNNGSTGDYHLTRNPNGGVSSAVIAVSNNVAAFSIPAAQDTLDFYAIPNGDHDFEEDEEIILTLAQAFSRSTKNQVEVNVDQNGNQVQTSPVDILQAPEFVSGNDPDMPVEINHDSYSRFINPSEANNELLGGRETLAVVPEGRSVQYFFYDEDRGNSDKSFESEPLLQIDGTTGEITKLRAMTEEEAGSPQTFTIKACDSEYNKLYDLATLTLTAVEFSMIPFTPKTTYFAPMPIPEDMWKANQVGIRRNTDYDNGTSSADSLLSVGDYAEDDFITVALRFDASTPNVVYSLYKEDASLKCWKGSSKSAGQYTFTDNECVLIGSGNIWVEYASSGNESYTLSLIARDADTHEILYSEDMTFRPFNSVTCAFVGENEIAGNPNVSRGINDWVISQLTNGYDVHVWDDGYDIGNEVNDCTKWGEGRAFEEVVNAVNNRGVTEVAVVGYSHGGGSVYNLTWRMYWDGEDPGILYSPRPDSITKPYTLVFTSYIDAVRNSSSATFTAESRRPLGSRYHLNQFQLNSSIHGCSVSGSDNEVDVTPLGVVHSESGSSGSSGSSGGNNSPVPIDVSSFVVALLTEEFTEKTKR